MALMNCLFEYKFDALSKAHEIIQNTNSFFFFYSLGFETSNFNKSMNLLEIKTTRIKSASKKKEREIERKKEQERKYKIIEREKKKKNAYLD